VARLTPRFLLCDDLEMGDVADEVVLDARHHRREHVEPFALPFGERVLLPHRAQVDALAQVVHLVEVLAPVLVDHRQHHAALDLAERLAPDRLFLLLVQLDRVVGKRLHDLLPVRQVELVARHPRRERGLDLVVELVEVPLLGVLGRTPGLDRVPDGALDGLERLVAQVTAVEDLLAAHVDHLALLVHDLVVLEDVLADLEVAILDRALRTFDRLGHHPCLERDVVGEGLPHHPVHGPRREEAHELVLEREVEAALARVALAPRPAPELVVDSAALVALRAEDVEPPELADDVAVWTALVPELRHQLLVALGRLFGRGSLGEELLARQALGVATEQDVDAAPGHVRGNRDRVRPSRLGDDDRFLLVLLGVQHRVRDAALLEQPRELLGLLHRDRADEDRLAGLVALFDVLGDGVELGVLGLVDRVGVAVPDHGLVRRDPDDLERVRVRELARLGQRSSRHAGELLVHAEVVLERDRRQRLVLGLDAHAFLRLDGLVEPFAPAPALEDAAGELVDDLRLAVLNDVVDVPLEQLLGAQRRLELVHEVLVDMLVQVVDRERLLDATDAFFGRDDRTLRFVDLVVEVALQSLHDACELVVQLLGVVGPARDDQRGPRLVDEDRVDLVDDREEVTPLGLFLLRQGHVVAQVVETELVVRA